MSIPFSNFSFLPVDLKCEYQINPLGIDQRNPILGWRLESKRREEIQTAYQLLVASTKNLLERDQGDLWDTGKVSTDETCSICYQGKPLVARQSAYWKVRAWDREDRVSPWSSVASWEMGLLGGSDWCAKWIDDSSPEPENDEDFYEEDPAPLFGKAIHIDRPIHRARLYISGLGYYIARINSKPIDESRALDPAWTDYRKRVFYSVYDVTTKLSQGFNTLTILLGNGWYHPLPIKMWGWLNLRKYLLVGRPCVIALLEMEFDDKTRLIVATDRNWKVTRSPILKNNLFLGEVYDARQEKNHESSIDFEDPTWTPVSEANKTDFLGKLRVQPFPPIRVTQTIPAVSVKEIRSNVHLFDLGENFSGWVKLRACGPRGTRVALRFGELLHEDGSLNTLTSVCGQIKKNGMGGPGAPEIAEQTDTYILKGEGEETYEPCFTYHGFRYVEVTGYPGTPSLSVIEGRRVHTDLPPSGSFHCSDETLNKIHQMSCRTFASNLHGVQTDCPTRERFGYGGDIVATADAFLYNFDMASFYGKVVDDFADTAGPDGSLGETAPSVGIADEGIGQGGPVGWTLALPLLLKKLYQHYGNRHKIQQYYPTVKRHVDLLQNTAKDHILDRGISDHESLVPKPVALTGTAFYYHHVCLLAEFATILSNPDDATFYRKLAQKIRHAARQKFYDPQTGQVDIGTQACQAIALYYNWFEPHEQQKILKRLLDMIHGPDADHLTTGIFGTMMVLEILANFGHAETAYKLITQKTFPGWGYMLAEGATTLWEHWEKSDNTFSHNHPMFGSVDAWFYKYLAGIQPAPDAVAFDHVLIKPSLIPGVGSVQTIYHSIRGPISLHWTVKENKLEVRLTLPANTTAEVYLPISADSSLIKESGTPISQIPEIQLLETHKKTAILHVGSGFYDLTAAACKSAKLQ